MRSGLLGHNFKLKNDVCLKLISSRYLIILIMNLCFYSVFAQPLAEVAHYGENIGTVAISETKGVINEGTRVRVMDIPLFDSLSFAGSVDVGGIPNNLKIVGSYAYSISHTGKFHIIDISNSNFPQITGELHIVDLKFSVWVRRSADYAYVTGCTGVHVIDIRNKNNPVLVTTLSSGCVYGMSGDGGYLYVCSKSSSTNHLMDIYSLADPRKPVLIGSGPNIKLVGVPQFNGISIFGDTIYIADKSETYVIDIADRTQPRLKSTLPRSRTDCALDVSNGILHESSWDRTNFYNLADPNAPQFKQQLIASYGIRADDVVAVGPLSYSARTNALWLTDQNAGTTKVVRSLTPDFGDAYTLTRSGDLLFVGSGSKVHVFNISNPSNPTLISSKSCSWVGTLASAGNYLYNASTSGNIEVFNFNNPANLTLSSTTGAALGQSVSHLRLVVKDGFAVLTSGNKAILYNVGSNGALSQRSVISLPNNDNAGDFSGSTLYICQLGGNILVYNISDITNPKLVTTKTAFNGNNYGAFSVACKVVGNKLHTLFGRQGYALFDISSPLSPVQIGSWKSGNQEGAGVEVAGRYVYLAPLTWLGSNSLLVLDIFNPNNIMLAYSGNATEGVYDIKVNNDYVYYAETKGGLRVRKAFSGSSGVMDWPLY